MKKTLVTLAKFGVSLAIIAWLLWRAAQDNHFAELRDGHKDWGLLAAAWLLCMGAVVATIIRWWLLVRALDLPFSLKDAFRLGFLGYLFNFVAPGSVGGDLFKAIFIARELHGRRAEAVATVVLDRIIGLYGLFLVASTAILTTGLAHSPVRQIQAISWATLIATVLGAVAILMVLTPGFTNGTLSDILKRVPRVGPIADKLLGAIRIYRRKLAVVALSLAISVGVHCLATMGVCLIAKALPGEAPSLGMHFIAVPLGMVTGLLPLPGGLGAFEAAIEFLYLHLPGAAAVSPGKGLVVALGYRVVTLVIAAIGVLYYLGSRREVAEVLHEVEEEEASAECPGAPGRTAECEAPVVQQPARAT